LIPFQDCKYSKIAKFVAHGIKFVAYGIEFVADGFHIPQIKFHVPQIHLYVVPQNLWHMSSFTADGSVPPKPFTTKIIT
jgi:hypothetical protein